MEEAVELGIARAAVVGDLMKRVAGDYPHVSGDDRLPLGANPDLCEREEQVCFPVGVVMALGGLVRVERGVGYGQPVEREVFDEVSFVIPDYTPLQGWNPGIIVKQLSWFPPLVQMAKCSAMPEKLKCLPQPEQSC